MNEWRLNNGSKIIQIASGRSNVYLIKCNTRRILIDTGKSTAANKIFRKLSQLGVSSIDWLILTHTHFDHCQTAALVQQKTACRILVSSTAKDYIEKGYTAIPEGTSWFSKKVKQFRKLLYASRFSYKPFNVTEYIEDRKIIETGLLQLEVIPTPGHSIDSLCIIVNGEIALVGDTLFGVYPNKITPPFANDLNLLRKQWEVLLQTPCSTFLPGHGKAISRELLQSCISNNEAK